MTKYQFSAVDDAVSFLSKGDNIVTGKCVEAEAWGTSHELREADFQLVDRGVQSDFAKRHLLRLGLAILAQNASGVFPEKLGMMKVLLVGRIEDGSPIRVFPEGPCACHTRGYDGPLIVGWISILGCFLAQFKMASEQNKCRRENVHVGKRDYSECC